MKFSVVCLRCQICYVFMSDSQAGARSVYLHGCTGPCKKKVWGPGDDGKICEEELPSYQETGDGHRIFCHIPIDELRQFDPVIHAPA